MSFFFLDGQLPCIRFHGWRTSYRRSSWHNSPCIHDARPTATLTLFPLSFSPDGKLCQYSLSSSVVDARSPKSSSEKPKRHKKVFIVCTFSSKVTWGTYTSHSAHWHRRFCSCSEHPQDCSYIPSIFLQLVPKQQAYLLNLYHHKQGKLLWRKIDVS